MYLASLYSTDTEVYVFCNQRAEAVPERNGFRISSCSSYYELILTVGTLPDKLVLKVSQTPFHPSDILPTVL